MTLVEIAGITGLIIVALLAGVFSVAFSGAHGGFLDQGDWLGAVLLTGMQLVSLCCLSAAMGIALWSIGFR